MPCPETLVKRDVARAGKGRRDSLESEFLACGVLFFDDAVGKNIEPIARRETKKLTTKMLSRRPARK